MVRSMGRRIDHSWGGPIELFLIPASAPQLVYQRLWYMLLERVAHVAAAGFLSHYLSGPLP